jgi:hypothetical protein
LQIDLEGENRKIFQTPPFVLIRTRVNEKEWRFEASETAQGAIEEFDCILEGAGSTRKLASQLSAFF